MQAIRLSKRSHFGLLFLTRLAQAHKAVSIRETAEGSGISGGYLEEIAAKLKGAGLIVALRGKDGGYRLAKKPDEISFADVLSALEGPTDLTECMSGGTCFECCGGRCATKKLVGQAQDALGASLSKITLADINE